ncbi:hypothetical protein [Streptomyces sp. NRRL WC-3744]|uniref:hypothetical protein n=1 Tax=Streptomyces sp. NRRL WC-3744 TaxID=1463935 RepID=UPI00131CB6D7|nr:hypothetical protein [Streptomyces sp. NRRL WC-3744]
MNTPIAQVVAEHLAVWNAPAGEERSRSIAALYSHDVIVAEPDTVYHGHDGVAEAIDALQAAVPGTGSARTTVGSPGPLDRIQRSGRRSPPCGRDLGSGDSGDGSLSALFRRRPYARRSYAAP